MLRILVVDDYKLVRRAVVRAIHSDFPDASIVEASDGAEGLNFYTEGGSFDLVITDMEMPRMNGAELHAALVKAGHPAHRVIAMTGNWTEFNASYAYFSRNPVVPVLNKPFEAEALTDLINKMLETES